MGNCISRDETEISGKDGHKANGHIGRGKNEQNIQKDKDVLVLARLLFFGLHLIQAFSPANQLLK